jgi:hypothetical protein
MGISIVFRRLSPIGLVVFFTLLHTSADLKAQSAAELQYMYLDARSSMEAGRYAQAQQLLARINSAIPQPFTKYARLYEGICMHHLGNQVEAMRVLQEVEDSYPSSDVQMEAILFRFHAALASAQNGLALQSFVRLPPDAQHTYRGTLLKALDAVSLDSLVILQKAHSQHQVLAQYTAGRIVYTGDRRYSEHAQALAKQFSLDIASFPRTPQAIRASKSRRDVAILLPLAEPLTDTVRKQLSGAYIFDYYTGLMWALDSLQKRTGKFTVHTLLTGRHVDTLRTVLDMPGMTQMDMVVGPVLTPLAHVTADFAQRHGILHFNPLNDQPSITTGRTFSFSPEPQTATIAQTVAQFMRNETLAKEAFILTGDSDKDTTLSGFLERSVKADSGTRIMMQYKFGRASSESLMGSLSTYTLDSLRCFLATITDPTAQAAMMSVLDRIPNMVEIYTGSDWLQNALISFTQFERRHFRFYFPDYIQYDHPVAQSFRQYYLSKSGVIPSMYAYKGVEHGLQLGRVLLQEDKEPATAMQETFLPGILMQGMDFRTSRQNSFVPLFRFEREQLIRINKPAAK